MSLTALAKSSLYRGGILDGYHRLRNRWRLTVVMFHRVLDEQDARWFSADPTWTVSARVFAECLEFFQAHYNVVGIEQLRQACTNQQPLPERPLLITFDDGWADNAEYALPCLRATGLPAVVFVVAGAVGQSELWNERLGRAWRSGSLDDSRRKTLSDGARHNRSRNAGPAVRPEPVVEFCGAPFRLGRNPAPEYLGRRSG